MTTTRWWRRPSPSPSPRSTGTARSTSPDDSRWTRSTSASPPFANASASWRPRMLRSGRRRGSEGVDVTKVPSVHPKRAGAFGSGWGPLALTARRPGDDLGRMATYDVFDRAAIVTGGGSGIGKATAELLAANGARVLVADVSDSATAVAEGINAAGGVAAAFIGDVTDPDGCRAMVAAAGELGPVRIAVNNAGIGGEIALTADYSLESWRRVIEVNLNSVFYCMQAELPVMVAAGGGSIVNMASILGTVGFDMSSAYVTAKHGLVGLTKNGALEYAAQGVRVNAVGPGFIATPLVDANLDADAQAALAAKHALGRLGDSQEVANLVAFLASDAATFVSGSYHLV